MEDTVLSVKPLPQDMGAALGALPAAPGESTPAGRGGHRGLRGSSHSRLPVATSLWVSIHPELRQRPRVRQEAVSLLLPQKRPPKQLTFIQRPPNCNADLTRMREWSTLVWRRAFREVSLPLTRAAGMCE